jgi:hypothetical protein
MICVSKIALERYKKSELSEIERDSSVSGLYRC